MAAASRNAMDLAKRTLHVKIYPTARTFAERREVLKVLEQFGEVAMFRSFKYHPRNPIPNAFLTLYNTEAAATAALNQSPIRYQLTATPSHDINSLGSAPASSPSDSPSLFELHISTTNFNHLKYLSSPSTNPLHGPYKPVSPSRSYIAASLEDVIVPSLWSAGLKDWETDDLAPPGAESDAAGPFGGTRHTDAAWSVAQRERRRREKSVPKIMKGLRAAYEEGLEERQSQG